MMRKDPYNLSVFSLLLKMRLLNTLFSKGIYPNYTCIPHMSCRGPNAFSQTPPPRVGQEP